MSLALWALTLPLALAMGCGGGAADSGNGPGLPPGDGGGADDGGADGGGADDGSDWVGGEGGGGGPEAGDDEVPGHLLELRQSGTWTVSPYPGPFESMSGELQVLEILDGDEALPACSARFALTGYQADSPCTDCLVAFEVQHVLAQDGDTTKEGEPIPGLEACLAPDLPAPDESWVLGLSTDGAVISRQVGVGTWVPWFTADLRLDEVEFSWSGTVGVQIEEEE